jgi:hypothetical protein
LSGAVGGASENLCLDATADCAGEAEEASRHHAQRCGLGDWAGSGVDGDVVEQCADVAVVAGVGVVEELQGGGAAGDVDELVDDDAGGVIAAGEDKRVRVVTEGDGGGGGVAALRADEVEAEIVGSRGEGDAGDQVAEVGAAGAAQVDAVARLGANTEIAEVGAADDVDVGAADGVELTGLVTSRLTVAVSKFSEKMVEAWRGRLSSERTGSEAVRMNFNSDCFISKNLKVGRCACI